MCFKQTKSKDESFDIISKRLTASCEKVLIMTPYFQHFQRIVILARCASPRSTRHKSHISTTAKLLLSIRLLTDVCAPHVGFSNHHGNIFQNNSHALKDVGQPCRVGLASRCVEARDVQLSVEAAGKRVGHPPQ